MNSRQFFSVGGMSVVHELKPMQTRSAGVAWNDST